jgi:hypothetical protein
LIPVVPQPEPHSFDIRVRQPGRAFLTANPNKKPRNFWNRAIDDLHRAYKGICAYTCVYIPHQGSADHFLPKSRYRDLVYEWNNYRLATEKVNSHKGESTEVIDPFIVQEGWFIIDFPSCLIRSAPNLSQVIAEQIEKTIGVLKLNTYDYFVQERCNIVLDFLDEHISFDFLSRRFPFLATEIHRQGGKDTLGAIFKRRSD